MHTARDNGVLDRNYRSERGMVIYTRTAAPFRAYSGVSDAALSWACCRTWLRGA